MAVSTQTARGLFPITPSDTSFLEETSRAIFVGNGGNLRILTPLDDDVTLTNVNPGGFLEVQAKKVFATGTTASGLFGVRN